MASKFYVAHALSIKNRLQPVLFMQALGDRYIKESGEN
jgi:hypothetical protein